MREMKVNCSLWSSSEVDIVDDRGDRSIRANGAEGIILIDRKRPQQKYERYEYSDADGYFNTSPRAEILW